MKQILIALIFSTLNISIYSQQVKKEVENGIYVDFPNNPKYSVTQEAGTYTARTENALYTVVIQYNMIPNYHQFVLEEQSWTEKEKKQVRDVLLDNVIKGVLAYTGATGNPIEIKIGSYYGRKISYSTINPATGEKGERFSVVLSVRNRLIFFDCTLLKESPESIRGKDSFINSIKSN
jgi:hypothetical protein